MIGATEKERIKSCCCLAKHDIFVAGSVIVWSGITYDGYNDLCVIRNGYVASVKCRDELMVPIVRLYPGAIYIQKL